MNVRKLYFNIKWEVMERGNGNERKYISVKCKPWHFISRLRLRYKLNQIKVQIFSFDDKLFRTILLFIEKFIDYI